MTNKRKFIDYEVSEILANSGGQNNENIAP